MSQLSATAGASSRLPAKRQAPGIAAGVSRLTAVWTLYALGIRQHVHGRRWLLMALIFSLPAGLALLVRATAPNVLPLWLEFQLVFMLIPQAMLPIVALAYAGGIVRDEKEDQTLTYLLIRPIPRWAVYAVKLLSALTTTVVLTTIFTALTFAAIYVGNQASPADVPLRCLKTILMHDLAVVAYCCLFGLLSLLTEWALLLGILYTIVVEGVMANMPFGIRALTVIFYGRSIAYQSLDFTFNNRGQTENLAARAWQIDLSQTVTQVSIEASVAVLVVASLVFTAIASLICARREFPVKTP